MAMNKKEQAEMEALRRTVQALKDIAEACACCGGPAQISKWQSRANWNTDEKATVVMVDAMKAEIAALRAALHNVLFQRKIPCGACDGSGKYSSDSTSECEECNGNGKVDSTDREFQ